MRRKKDIRKKRDARKRFSEKISLWGTLICHLIVAAALVGGLFVAEPFEPIKQLDMKVGEIANETVVAPVKIEDALETEKRREEARNSIADIYKKNNELTTEIYNNVMNSLRCVETVSDLAKSRFEDWRAQRLSEIERPVPPGPEYSEDSPEYKEYIFNLNTYNSNYSYYTNMNLSDLLLNKPLYTQVFDANFFYNIDIEINNRFTSTQIQTIMFASETQLDLAKNNITDMVLGRLNNAGIKESELGDIIESIQGYFVSAKFSTELLEIIDEVLYDVSFNVVFDAAGTEKARVEAANKVSPVEYQKGQVIVSQGQPVTSAQYRIMKELGLVETDAEALKKAKTTEALSYVSLSVAVVIICALQCLVIISYKKRAFLSVKNNIIVSILMIAVMYIFAFVKDITPYICTPMLAVILITLLLDGKMAIIAGVSLSLLAGIYSGGNFTATLTALVACAAAACLIRKATSSRGKIILFGMAATAIELLTAIALDYYTTGMFETLLKNTVWILIGGGAASVLAIGLLPVFENVFSVITPIKLLELSNQSQPVLKRLQIEASGTYYHSIIVGNMAETAANDIGADGLLARIGAYYHDIGKLMRPQMFKENQTDGYNPHDELSPEASAKIIIAHVKEGLALAEEYKVPKLLHQFIEEHHGSTIAAYFYNNACNIYGKENVNINDFKYSGKTPTTKECAIVMMADTVEAAVRAMKTQNKEEVKEAIDKLVQGKMDMGQLSNCPLTFKEITTIKQSFLTILSGAFHQRVEYPKLKEAENGKKDDNN